MNDAASAFEAAIPDPSAADLNLGLPAGTDQPIPGVAFSFVLPTELEAKRPAELRGLRRDRVRLMVLPRLAGKPIHTRFDAIVDYFRPGDVLVVNNSRTLPALLQAVDEHGRPVEVRLAARVAEDVWNVLLLDGRRHIGAAGMQLSFGEGLTAYILDRAADLPFLWQMQFSHCCMQLLDSIYRLGVPVRYAYLEGALPLDLYQTVYAAEPGSVEMPSAGRPFTWELLIRLQRQGIKLAAVTLHTGLSSTRDDAVDTKYPVQPEFFRVSAAAAETINTTRSADGRVIAVGTSVVRTLETAADDQGTLRPGEGVTQLRIQPGYIPRCVDGLLSGMHEPQASHLDLLSAFVDPLRLEQAYQEAVSLGYLWHEFGDMNLIL